jgi:hypothetical protein
MDEVVPLEDDCVANPQNQAGPYDHHHENASWAAKRDEWAQQMWVTRNGAH